MKKTSSLLMKKGPTRFPKPQMETLLPGSRKRSRRGSSYRPLTLSPLTLTLSPLTLTLSPLTLTLSPLTLPLSQTRKTRTKKTKMSLTLHHQVQLNQNVLRIPTTNVKRVMGLLRHPSQLVTPPWTQPLPPQLLIFLSSVPLRRAARTTLLMFLVQPPGPRWRKTARLPCIGPTRPPWNLPPWSAALRLMPTNRTPSTGSCTEYEALRMSLTSPAAV